ncbi:BACON domain-containing protein [Hoylesella enoeca]|uniref:BACON domain-containing protein n=1 Tax=Hoylesella enoeca TaxID=76123 RepID=A0A0S2KN41_9BACT|nr:BACON domain-containing protein [Hoylesella enoeca]ALO49653.1 hypothetical protein AS203_11640 [Hoylesella enoeca]
MEKIVNIWLLAMALFVAGACSDDKLVGTGKITKTIMIDNASVNFTDAPGTGRVKVTAAQGITKVESTSDWCTATIEGNAVVVKVTQNMALTGRAAQLTIWSADDTQQVTVQQLGLPDLYSRGKSRYTVNSKDTVLTFPLISPAGYPITATTDGAWLQASAANGVATITVTTNVETALRRGKVTFTSGPRGDKLEASVSQKGSTATVQ